MAETRTGYWCSADDQLVEPVSVYECGKCGERTDERRCPNCNTFASRDGDGCPDCFGEVLEVQVVTDHDGTEICLEDYEPAGLALSARHAAEDARHAAQAEARRAQQTADALATSAPTTWAHVRVGDRVLDTEPPLPGMSVRASTVLDLFTAGTDATTMTPGTVVAVIDQYGTRVTQHAPDDQVRVMTDTNPTNPEIAPVDARITTIHDPNAWVGSGMRAFHVRTGLGDDITLGSVPVAYILGTTTPTSGAMSTFGTFIDPADARAYANTARTAADHLTDNAGRRPSHTDVTVTISDEVRITANLTRWVTFEYGEDDGDTVVQVRTEQRHGRGSYSASVSDRLAMLALADAADLAADWLTQQTDLHH